MRIPIFLFQRIKCFKTVWKICFVISQIRTVFLAIAIQDVFSLCLFFSSLVIAVTNLVEIFDFLKRDAVSMKRCKVAAYSWRYIKAWLFAFFYKFCFSQKKFCLRHPSSLVRYLMFPVSAQQSLSSILALLDQILRVSFNEHSMRK